MQMLTDEVAFVALSCCSLHPLRGALIIMDNYIVSVLLGDIHTILEAGILLLRGNH